MSAFDVLLDRLTHVKRTSRNTAIASCPTKAHKKGDRSRGLSVRSIEERVLIYCHAGCGAGEVVDALGLTLSDLYDEPQFHRAKPIKTAIPARDLLEILDEEVLTIGMLALHWECQRELPAGDWGRLKIAIGRISAARSHFHNG